MINPSPQTEEFIRTHIRSIWQLELLLFFHDSPTSITVEEASSKLYLMREVILAACNDFVEKNFLFCEDGGYRYNRDNGMAEMIGEAAALHSERKTTLINLIYNRRY